MKRQRILTNRDFPDTTHGYEFIEKDILGNFYWRAGERIYKIEELDNGVNLTYDDVEGCFPVDEEFVKDKFIECGRVYNPGYASNSQLEARGEV